MKVGSNFRNYIPNSFTGRFNSRNSDFDNFQQPKIAKTASSPANKRAKQAALLAAAVAASAAVTSGAKYVATETTIPQTIVEEYNETKDRYDIEKLSDKLEECFQTDEFESDKDISKTDELIAASIDSVCEFDAKYGDIATKLLLAAALIKIHFLKSDYINLAKHFNALNEKVDYIDKRDKQP